MNLYIFNLHSLNAETHTHTCWPVLEPDTLSCSWDMDCKKHCFCCQDFVMFNAAAGRHTVEVRSVPGFSLCSLRSSHSLTTSLN